MSGQEGNVSQDETDRSELEAEARVLPERELMSLIAAGSTKSSPPVEDGEDVPQGDSESTSS